MIPAAMQPVTVWGEVAHRAVVECCALDCNRKFVADQGVIYPVTIEGHVRQCQFCSMTCILKSIPPVGTS